MYSDFKVLAKQPDYHAPDGSEIRLLLKVPMGNMWHCKLPATKISNAVYHKTVDEIWYVLEGNGELWLSDKGETINLIPNICISIPRGTSFQFKNTGKRALKFLGVTIPVWPRCVEACNVEGKWKSNIKLVKKL
jgi:mannose-6-phosphate isomerase-like protein (cupin superfamily)